MDQKEQKSKFIELANLIREAGKLYGDCILNPSVAEDNKRKILELETQGDSIQDQLDDHFRNQKNIPYLALDRAKLVRKLDDTLDDIKLAGLTFTTFVHSLPKDFSTKCDRFAKILIEVTSCLAQGVEIIYTSFKDALDIVTEIETLRDEAMDISFNLENEYFESIDEWKEFNAISRIIKRSMACIVEAKESSEVLELMAYKYD
ncbi:MAG: DUF47 family protein [Candidatus Kariarchaeaceae archaeon]|jgi:predicted phosphate transport protein (TIGR00153 family)